MTWTHDSLADDLAGHLRGNSERFVWTDMQLGPVASPRPDVYTLPKSFSRWTPLAYECKVSRSDFRADVTKGKWQDYLQFAGAVIFATPAGLIEKTEVPPGCGLMHRTDKQWRTIQRPTLRTLDNLPKDAWMKILLDGMDRHRQTIDPNRGTLIRQYIDSQAIKKKFGQAIGELLSGRERAEQDFQYQTERLHAAAEDAKREYDKIIARAKERADKEKPEVEWIKADLCKLLDCPPDTPARLLRSHAQQQFDALSRDHEIQRLTQIISYMRTSLQHAERAAPAIARNESPE